MFQIFAQLIELRPAPLPGTYMAIFRPLLAPVFWERPGNIPALTRLLQAYCAKAMPEITQQGLLEVGGLLSLSLRIDKSQGQSQGGPKRVYTFCLVSTSCAQVYDVGLLRQGHGAEHPAGLLE